MMSRSAQLQVATASVLLRTVRTTVTVGWVVCGWHLELEPELEKSDRYCYLLTTKGKKAESLYKSPDFFQMTIKSFFKTI